MKFKNAILSKPLIVSNGIWLIACVAISIALAVANLKLERSYREYEQLEAGLMVQAMKYEARMRELTQELEAANGKLNERAKPIVEVRERIVKDFVSTPGGGISSAGVETLNRMQAAK